MIKDDVIRGILIEEWELLRTDLIKRHNQLGMKASGRWERELAVFYKRMSVALFGEHYTYYLVNGRKAGKMPPVKAIKQWIEDKGIASNIKGKISVSSLAFLIARKIGREGTRYYRRGGTNLIESVVTPQRIQRIMNRVGDSVAIEVAEELFHLQRREFQKIA